jgi:hypothetical protein
MKPSMTSLDTGSLERSLLIFSAPRGPTSNDLSHLLFTCTNTSQVAPFEGTSPFIHNSTTYWT